MSDYNYTNASSNIITLNNKILIQYKNCFLVANNDYIQNGDFYYTRAENLSSYSHFTLEANICIVYLDTSYNNTRYMVLTCFDHNVNASQSERYSGTFFVDEGEKTIGKFNLVCESDYAESGGYMYYLTIGRK